MERPLFIPLRREWFDKIERGTKRVEYRAHGPRWNAKTCRVGRAVTISLGYGKSRRLSRVVGSFVVLHRGDVPPEVQAIYPEALFIAAIGLE